MEELEETSEVNPKDCPHEFVLTEYLSQPYGHCSECNCSVVRDEDGKWRLP